MSFNAESPGVLGAVRIDLRRLHATWMALVFPRQRSEHSVMGRWTPDDEPMATAYKIWSAIGLPLVALVYPLVLAGFATRFYTRRINRAVAALGFAGATGVVALLWGVLTVVARTQFASDGFLAVAAAAIVATLSATLAMLFATVDGRATTVLLAYPFAMTAVFLPPVVASFFYDPVAGVIIPLSDGVAIWMLDSVLPDAISSYLRANFRLRGIGLLAMWAGIAVPLGWLAGGAVTLADVVRPTDDDAAGTTTR